jgi:hypothetical protein
VSWKWTSIPVTSGMLRSETMTSKRSPPTMRAIASRPLFETVTS